MLNVCVNISACLFITFHDRAAEPILIKFGKGIVSREATLIKFLNCREAIET